jgi:SAM-dependent methyltransferase
VELDQAGFYIKTLEMLLRRDILSLDSRILVVCGGMFDRFVLEQVGFNNVVISNVDTRTSNSEFAPFEWNFQDVENLTYSDDSFDFCIVHSGLHHCNSPHQGLLEMYRVSRKGVLVFEPCDNLATRIGVWLGVGQEYELAAVAGNEFRHGGVRNTAIPNYIYRWTQREVVKTINTYAPHTKNQFLFFYALRIPWLQFSMRKNKLVYLLMRLASPFLYFFAWLFPTLSNNFSFVVIKTPLAESLQPWLVMKDGRPDINREYVESSLKSTVDVG